MKNKELLIKRAAIIDQIRAFFKERGYLEVETPKIVKYPGQEFNLEPFETRLIDERGRTQPAFLITSPEFSCKKLLAQGFEKIFELGKCFRNREACDKSHNSEFTMLEWYRANADYGDIMDETEELVLSLAGKKIIFYQGREIDLSRPWSKMSLNECFQKWAQIDLEKNLDKSSLAASAEKIGIEINQDYDFEEIFHKIFLNLIEPNFPKSQPLIIYDYPVQMGALARAKPEDPRFAERFEVYLAGQELANAFSELNDPKIQEKRFLEEQEKRQAIGRPVHPIDKDFLKALGHMPEAAGIALGVDRLAMILADAPDIGSVLAFDVGDIFN